MLAEFSTDSVPFLGCWVAKLGAVEGKLLVNLLDEDLSVVLLLEGATVFLLLENAAVLPVEEGAVLMEEDVLGG